MLCFHFHSAQNILIFWLFSLTHGLFRSVVFSWQISEIFPNNFLLLIFNSSIVVREHNLYDLNVFKFIEIRFMVHNMVSLDKCFSCWGKECVLCFFFVSIRSKFVDSIVWVFHLYKFTVLRELLQEYFFYVHDTMYYHINDLQLFSPQPITFCLFAS